MNATLFAIIALAASVASLLNVPYTGTITLIAGVIAIVQARRYGETKPVVIGLIGIAVFLISFSIKISIASRAYDRIRDSALEAKEKQKTEASTAPTSN